MLQHRQKSEQIEEHYRELHAALDELTAYFIQETGHVPSETTVLDLMIWASQQFHEKRLHYGT